MDRALREPLASGNYNLLATTTALRTLKPTLGVLGVLGALAAGARVDEASKIVL